MSSPIDAIIDATQKDTLKYAIRWAERNDVPIPDNPEKMKDTSEPWKAYGKRLRFIRNIAKHTRSLDISDEVVDGRLESLAESFRRSAELAMDGERYSAYDIWNDAETETKRMIKSDEQSADE